MSVPRITELMESYISGLNTYIANISGHVDGYTEALTGFASTISSDHNYIHQGMGFCVPLVTTSLAAAGTWKVGFTTPNTTPAKYVHWRPTQFSSTGNAARYRLYEKASFTGGTNAQPINRNRNKSAQANFKFYAGVTAALTGNLTITTKAGGGFANQPGGGKITIVSDNNVEDKLISATIYGTITGATTTVTTETKALNGTTPVDTTVIVWQNALAFELSAAPTGTITFKNAAGNTIATIAPGVLSAGVETPSILDCDEQILTAVASGITTSPIGVIGTGVDQPNLTSVVALNNTSTVNVNTTLFSTISKVLIGAVAGTRTVSVSIPNKIIETASCGSGNTSSRSGGVGGGSDLEYVLLPNTSYVAVFENIGSVAATDIDAEFFFYEELGGGA